MKETSIDLKQEENMSSSLMKSLGIHGLIALMLFVTSWVSPLVPSKKFFKLNPEIKFLKSAVRVDVVAMPTQTLEELKKVEIAPMPTAEEIKAAKVSEEKVEAEKNEENPEALELKKFEKKKNLLSILKNISKASELSKKSSSVSPKLKGLTGKDLRGVVLLGNKVSQGNSITGTSGEADAGAFASYVSAIPFKIKPFWKLPSYLMGKNLQCRVRVFIAGNGELINAEVYESSGVPDYDEKAIEAIKAASPFPVPETAYRSRLLNGEIALGFPL